MAGKVKVLYIGGSHRSGSTLMESIIGQAAGVTATGELKNLLRSLYVVRGDCMCGSQYSDCEFWSRVTREAFGPSGPEDDFVQRGVELAHGLSRLRKRLVPGYGRRMRTFIEQYMRPVYTALDNITGGNVIVDASNLAWHLKILSKCDFIDLHLLHLVRDSRAVAYSFIRKKKVGVKPDGTDIYMPTYSSATSAKLWAANNMHTWLIGRKLPEDRYLRLGYEDFCASPREQTARILSFIGVDPGEPGMYSGDREVMLGGGHMIMGNPMKFEKGHISIKLDDEWKRKMSFYDRAVVTLLTWPALKFLR